MIDKVMQFCYTMQMKTTLTAKLKLNTDDEQFKALRTTQLAYRDALNFVSQYAFAHGKMSNKVGLQEGTYLIIVSGRDSSAKAPDQQPKGFLPCLVGRDGLSAT